MEVEIKESTTTTTDIFSELITNITLFQSNLENLKHAVRDLVGEKNRIQRESEKLNKDKDKFEKEKAFVAEINRQTTEKVNLNVGGEIMSTTRSTLYSIQDSLLGVMFSGRHRITTDKDGCYFIDRDPKIFRYLLNYLRDQKLNLQTLQQNSILFESIIDEFDYFCVPLLNNFRDAKEKSLLNYSEFVNFKTFEHHFSRDDDAVLSDLSISSDFVVACGKNPVKPAESNLIIINTRSDKIDKFLPGIDIHSTDILGNYIVAGCDSQIWIIDVSTNRQSSKENVSARHVRFYNNKIVSCSFEGEIQIWKFFENGFVFEKEKEYQGQRFIFCMDIENHLLATGGFEGGIEVWDLNSGSKIRCLQRPYTIYHTKIFQEMIWESRKKKDKINVWNISSGKFVKQFQCGYRNSTVCVQDDAILSVTTADDLITIWDFFGNCCFTLAGHKDTVKSVVVKDDVIVSISFDKTIRIWKGVRL